MNYHLKWEAPKKKIESLMINFVHWWSFCFFGGHFLFLIVLQQLRKINMITLIKRFYDNPRLPEIL